MKTEIFKKKAPHLDSLIESQFGKINTEMFMKILFYNIEDICSVNTSLLEALIKAFQNPEKTEKCTVYHYGVLFQHFVSVSCILYRTYASKKIFIFILFFNYFFFYFILFLFSFLFYFLFLFLF